MQQMGLLSRLTRKKKKIQHWVEVRWSRAAVEKGLGYNYLKDIYFFYNGRVYRRENYSEPLLKSLKLDGIPVVDRTARETVPQSKEIPGVKTVLGRLQFSRRVF